jgi:hypothetical protein
MIVTTSQPATHKPEALRTLIDVTAINLLVQRSIHAQDTV